MKILFVGGVHGVGKSTLCDEIAPDLQANHVSSGDLLQWSGASKVVEDLVANQETILNALEHLNPKPETMLLDGHYCLLTDQGRAEPVPLRFFRHLNPVALLLVEADVEEISKRLAKRDGSAPSMAALEELCKLEAKSAQRISEVLGLPLRIVSSNDADEAHQFLSEVLEE